MKRVVLFVVFLLLINPVWAEDNSVYSKVPKCIDLETSMYNKRATLYNVLNLTPDQQKCKDTMDMNYLKEVGDKFEKYSQEKYVLNNLRKHNASKSAIKQQEKVVKNLEKQLEGLEDKYLKEFMTILTSEQKAKVRNIRKMEKGEKGYSKKQKPFYKHDSKLRPFGENMYYGDNSQNVLCPVHNKYHLFGRKHKVK